MYKANGKVWKVLEYDTTSFINLYETSVYYDIDTDLVASAYYKLAYTSDTEWYDASWHYEYDYNEEDQTLSEMSIYTPEASGKITYGYDNKKLKIILARELRLSGDLERSVFY